MAAFRFYSSPPSSPLSSTSPSPIQRATITSLQAGRQAQMDTAIDHFFIFFLVTTLSLVARGSSAAVDRAKVGVVTMQLWCVAKNNAEDPVLQEALNWACGQGGAGCGPIQQGGACFFSDDLQTMASYAFNDYYLNHGRADDSCNFANSAALTSVNPSKGKCKFPSSSMVINGSFSAASTSTTVGSGQALADSSGCNSVPDQWRRFILISFLIVLNICNFG